MVSRRDANGHSLAFAYSRENATDASNIPKLPTLLGRSGFGHRRRVHAARRCGSVVVRSRLDRRSRVLRVRQVPAPLHVRPIREDPSGFVQNVDTYRVLSFFCEHRCWATDMFPC